jgi:6-phosphofructokinase 1
MANIKTKKGTIAILTGGGDVPGLNPAIRAVTIRAIREGYQVIGIRRGWAGVVELIRDKKTDNSNNYQILTEEIVNKAGRTGGTFLHIERCKRFATIFLDILSMFCIMKVWKQQNIRSLKFGNEP